MQCGNIKKSISVLFRTIVMIMILSTVLMSVCSCVDNTESGNSGDSSTSVVTEYVVSFETNCDVTVADRKIKKGEKIEAPANFSEIKIEKRDNYEMTYEFKGWYNNDALWDFNNAIESDLTLKAVWEQVKIEVIRTL